MRFSTALLDKFIAKTKHTGILLAAYPNKQSIYSIIDYTNSLSLPPDFEKTKNGEFHVTLSYFKMDEFDGDLDDVIDTLKAETNLEGKITVSKFTLDILGEDNALVLKIESKELDELQVRLAKKLEAVNVPPSKYPKFLAHLTLGYSCTKEQLKEVNKRDVSISKIVFNKIKLINGNDQQVLFKEKFGVDI